MVITKKDGKRILVTKLTVLQNTTNPKLPKGWQVRSEGYKTLLERENHVEVTPRKLTGLRNEINKLNPMVKIPD